MSEPLHKETGTGSKPENPCRAKTGCHEVPVPVSVGVIAAPALRRLVDEWIAAGRTVAGPRRVKDFVLYQRLPSAAELLLEGFIHPRNSIKEFVFPRHETLYGYRVHGRQIELVDAVPPAVEQIIIAARPCDAATLPILDHVFNWDYKDEFYNRRRELTTVVSLACREYDSHCFCTSVDSGPGDPRGSDAMLVDLGNGSFEVRCLTEKGRRLFEGKTEPAKQEGQIAEGPPRRVDLEAVGQFLSTGYEDSSWQEMTRRCLGCGACAYTCPTCHCFDMVDEGSPSGGQRVRNWDACQFAMFTMHASGHNPRNAQAQRQRQRIFHKFQIYPEKFGTLLCTGCGNCSRNCPVGLGVRPVLEMIQET